MNRRWEFFSCFTSHLPQQVESRSSHSLNPRSSIEASIDFVSPIVIIFLFAALFSVDKLNERGNLIRSLSLFFPNSSFLSSWKFQKKIRKEWSEAVYENRNNRLRAFDYRELIEADLSSDPTSAGKLARRCYDAHGSTFRELEFDEAVPIFAKFDTHRLHADFLA